MADMRGLKSKFAKALDEARYRTTRRGVTGNGTSANPRDGLLPGFVWVRLSDQRDAVAVRGTVNQVDVPVLVSRDIDGGYYIERLDSEPAIASFGQAAYQALQPPLTQISSPIDSALIKAGRVRLSEAGGLWVHVEAFAYDNGYFVGGELLLVPTATANKRAWVLVYYDPATGALDQELGNDLDLAITPLPSSIEDIAIPDNAIPLGAVNLANAQTTIAGSDIQDARYHITKRRALYYQTVTDDGTPMAQQPILDFFGSGVTVTNDAGNNRTRIEITGGGGGTINGDVLPITFEARLTLTSGVPVTTSDVTAATTVYLTPYRGSVIALYDGATDWNAYALSEISLSLSGFTANSNYDIFVYDNSGTLTLEAVIWTNNTTRATSIVLQNGVYLKSGDLTKRYAGTIRITSSTGQAEDSIARRFVYNYYSQIYRQLRVVETANSWVTNVSPWRPFNNSTANRVEVVVGVEEKRTRVQSSCFASPASAGNYSAVGVGIDSTSVNSAGIVIGGAVNHSQRFAIYDGYLSSGYHYIQMLEGTNGSNTTFYGDNGTTWLQSGMVGETWA